jgi:signal transduction histidine kinase
VIAEQAAGRERRAREDRDRLIATVTHDLATPLSVLSGTVQFVKRHRTGSEADLSRLLGRIETASARATALIRTLADAQALESQDFALRTDTHDLRALVGPIVEMMDRFSETSDCAGQSGCPGERQRRRRPLSTCTREPDQQRHQVLARWRGG